MKKKHEQNLVGWDAARTIRQAQRELAEYVRQERRKAEVDHPENDPRLKVDVMAFETAGGQWRLETLAPIFEGQAEGFSATDKTEALAEAELRFKLRNELIQSRWCNPLDAQRYAARAQVNVCGRVPYKRIQIGG